MNPQLQRGLLLYQQNRLDLAEQELRQALASDPHEAFGHSLLALCLARRSALDDATAEAQQAVHLAPEAPFSHYTLASVLHDRRHLKEALASAREAIRLDPSEADYHALEAQIHLDEKRWTEGLAAADRGLQLDAENIACTNLRAIALVKLGRKAEAGATIDDALRRNPDNAVTHANQGWASLEQSEARRALDHFREALRLDPENEWARAGLVEALKARNIIYAAMLRYFLWMARLPPRAQVGVIIGGYFLNRMLGSAAADNPKLAPWILPFQIVYLTFALLTWTAAPLFNLLLRLNSYGRFALTDEQTRASNWFAAVVIPALVSLALCLVFGFGSIFILSALVFGFLMIPVSGTFKASPGWPRKLLMTATLVLATLGLSALGYFGAGELTGGNPGKALLATGKSLLSLFVTGSIIFMWGAMFIIPIQPRR